MKKRFSFPKRHTRSLEKQLCAILSLELCRHDDQFFGDKFKAVSQDFGRPAVETWLPLYFSSGKAKHEKPVFATREMINVAPDIDLEMLRNKQYKLHRQSAKHPENQSGFIGLDVNSWKMVRFALWTRPQETLYQSSSIT